MTSPAELRLQHLQFIQDVINRLAQNSFAVKGWSITLSAGIFTFLLSQDPTKQVHPIAYLIVIIPSVVFWLLDAYYLQQERLFRCLYDAARKDLAQQIGDQTVVAVLDMNTNAYRQERPYWKAVLSKTVFGIPYMIILASSLLALIDNAT